MALDIYKIDLHIDSVAIKCGGSVGIIASTPEDAKEIIALITKLLDLLKCH